MKITDYTVVRHDSVLDLTNAVKIRMREGWQPQGPMAVCQEAPGQYASKDVHYYQTMVKYEEAIPIGGVLYPKEPQQPATSTTPHPNSPW